MPLSLIGADTAPVARLLRLASAGNAGLQLGQHVAALGAAAAAGCVRRHRGERGAAGDLGAAACAALSLEKTAARDAGRVELAPLCAVK